MASLISDAEKAIMEAQIASVADTFARPLTIVRQAKEIVIYNNPNHSFIYQKASTNTAPTVVPVTGVYQGRIWYERQQPLDLMAAATRVGAGTTQTTIQMQDGRARLKLDISGAQFINGAERAQFDGNTFTIESTARPHGLFTPQYYTYWLKRTQ